MFSRWQFVRLRAAENALNDGRIDEAYQCALEPDLRDDPRAQKLLDALAKPLLARARVHANGGRYREALDDLDKLDAVERGGNDAAALRLRITEEIRAKHGRSVEERETYERAAKNLEAGRLASARLAIERVQDERKREQLQEELDIRVARSGQVLEQARVALDGGDVLTACRLWTEAVNRHGASPPSDALGAALAATYRNELDLLLDAGRLDRFMAALRLGGPLHRFDPALEAFDRVAALCTQAGAQLERCDHAALRETLLRLRAARSGSAWLEAALGAAGTILGAQEQLLSSPLGLLAPAVEKSVGFGTVPARRAPDNEVVPAVAVDPAAVALGRDPLLVLVDGMGSSLLVAREVVRIGRAGGEREIDVPIPGDVFSHHADIIRDGEDYFLMAHGPAQINGRDVSRALLRDGDRITFGPKAKLVFQKPSAKSDSAVLRVSDRCRLPQDVSHVVLFVDTCLIGSLPSCHLRTREGQSRLVLFDRTGRLYGRMANADGRPVGAAEPIVLEQTRDFGDVRLTVKRYEVQDSGGLT